LDGVTKLDFDDWKDDADAFEFWLYELVDGEEVPVAGVEPQKLNGSDTVTFIVSKKGSYIVKEEIDDAAYYIDMSGTINVQPTVKNTKITILSEENDKDDSPVVVDPDGTYHPGGVSLALKAYYNSRLSDKLGFDILSKGKWVWNCPDSWRFGVTGSIIIHYITEFDVDGEIGEAFIYFACDNAAVLYVNDVLVGSTDYSFNVGLEDLGNWGKGLNVDDVRSPFIDDLAWENGIAYVDLKPHLRQGPNTIMFYAANCDDSYTGKDYSPTNNPCALIFSGEVNVVKEFEEVENPDFENKQLPKKILGKEIGGFYAVNLGNSIYKNTASEENSYFPFVELDEVLMKSEEGQPIEFRDGNSGSNKKETLAYRYATVKLIEGNLVITFDNGVNTASDVLLTNVFNGNPQSNADTIKVDPIVLKYNGEGLLYIKMKAKFWQDI